MQLQRRDNQVRVIYMNKLDFITEELEKLKEAGPLYPNIRTIEGHRAMDYGGWKEVLNLCSE